MRGKAQEDKLKELQSKHKRPANVENLQVPKVDEQLWRQLRRETKSQDYILQKTQGTLSLALIPVAKALNLAKDSNKPELKEMIADTFKIITQAISSSNTVRREKIKKDLDPKYRSICITDNKVTLTMNATKKSFLGKRGEAISDPASASSTATSQTISSQHINRGLTNPPEDRGSKRTEDKHGKNKLCK